MKRFATLIAFAAALATSHAQWKTESYDLADGWSAIYLHGDASAAQTIGDLLPASVVEVWRWNPNPSQLQFTTSPNIPAAGTPEWSVWRRPPLAPGDLTTLEGGHAYLVKSTAAAGGVSLSQRPLPPRAVWLRSGANLLGFPTSDAGGGFPLFSDYFATFPAAVAANTKIFHYPGGPLGPANPVQVFNPGTERVDRSKAYWFESAVVGNFYAPVEISFSNPAGIDFGRGGTAVTARLHNRTAATLTVTLTPGPSDAPPAGEPAITGDVPLRLRTFNTGTGQFDQAPITAANNEVVLAAGASAELSFGLDRAAMGGNSGDQFASLLGFTDSDNHFDITVPVRAGVGSLAGLWIGDAAVSTVESKVDTLPASGETTPRPFPLRLILHVDDGGEARLLSQVFMGPLDEPGAPFGLCTKESALDPARKADARRLGVVHLPLDRVVGATSPGTNTGTVAVPGTLVRTVEIPFNDPTNPFVHQYHPDHDNRDARPDGTNVPKGDGEESYSVTRQCTFAFTTVSGNSLGGDYSETLTGLHKETITVGGTFRLRRVSELGTITLD